MKPTFRARNVPSSVYAPHEDQQHASLHTEQFQQRHFKKLRIKKVITRLLLILGFTVLLAVITLGGRVAAESSHLLGAFGEGNVLIKIKHLIAPPEKTIMGESDDQINILMLGIGGQGHEGELLTDAMGIMSIQPSTKQAAVISIPRDLYVPIPGYGMRRINNAYALGQMSNTTTGGRLAMDTAQKVFNIPIHFYARIDFAGFQNAINAIGGIDVDVKEKLVDPFFPVANTYGVRTLVIEKGFQHMDGKVALDYARSRQTTSDFSRAHRQQEILAAVKNKVASSDILSKTMKAEKLIGILGDHFETNIQPWQLLRLLEIGKTLNTSSVVYKVIDDSENGPLKSTIGGGGAYYLVPKSGTYEELQNLARNLFENSEVVLEKARIIVENGTTSPGLARTIGNILKAKNFDIVAMNNAASLNTEKTVVYDISLGEKNITFNALLETLGAQPGVFIPDDVLSKKDSADIVVVLGKDKIPLNAVATQNTTTY
ncbi:MAG: Cell envelope-related transcriptional attenuator [Parcubacteria group bacterium GW2011_GWA2_44_12]|nr:MAG: Cell envelope-related transcriptional attenuator [Parcubacteria group bacterium GW2011_GWA2_44_12]